MLESMELRELRAWRRGDASPVCSAFLETAREHGNAGK
jgi:hypothetical protein